MKRILCYGDSLTWGYVPGTSERWDENTRWTMLLQKNLGSEYFVIENGINGRTTAFDRQETEEYLNGVKGLGYALLAAKPLDLVIVLLGINDLNLTDAYTSARGLSRLGNRIMNANSFYRFMTPPMGNGNHQLDVFPDEPRLLIISPCQSLKIDGDINPRSTFAVTESAKYREYTKSIAEKLGAYWMDAGDFCKPSEIDGVHFSKEANKNLAKAVADKVCQIFSE